jgi:hypothetical protein
MVSAYLDTSPNPSTYDFLKHDFDTLEALYGGVTGVSFRPFPSYPQRFQERLAEQPACSAELMAVDVEPWREPMPRACFTEDDLHALDDEMKAVVQDAWDFADASPEPPLEALYEDVLVDTTSDQIAEPVAAD